MNLAVLRSMLESVAAQQDPKWRLRPDEDLLRVPVGNRHQDIGFSIDREHVVLSTVVVASPDVARNRRSKDLLTVRCWMRNAESNIVTFTFDEDDNLISRVRHLAEHLDSNELELYVHALSEESDRFEYVLSLKDVN